MGRAALIFTVMIIAVGAIPAYRAYSRHRDLSETIAWMDQTYNPHEGGENGGSGHGNETHYLRNAKLQTEDITQEFHQTFAYKGRCIVVIHYETVPIGVYKNMYSKGDYTLNLCDIDPTTIKIDKFDFHKDIGGCDDPGYVSLFELNCTSAEVEFHTWNEIPKIKDDRLTTFPELTGKDHESKGSSMSSKGWFIVDDAAYAERFAKALKHAVELCGGRQSKF
jgi:hypothetical protein